MIRSREEPCHGAGQESDGPIEYEVGRCPICHALAPIERKTGRIEDHKVTVIG